MPDNSFAFPCRRFLLSVVVVFATIIAASWWCVINAPMYYLEPGYPMWKAKMQMIGTERANGVVILGDSRPLAGLVPRRLGSDVINIAFGGGTSIEMYFATRRIIEKGFHPKAVLVYISPFHFVIADCFWNRSIQFGLLNLKDVEEIRNKSRELNDNILFGPPSPGDLEAQLKSILYTNGFPSYYFPSLINGRIYMRHSDNERIFNEILANRGQFNFSGTDEKANPDMDAGLKSYVPSKLLSDYFDRTLDLLASKNIPVYFVPLPHNVYSEPFYFPGFRENFVSDLRKRESVHPNFHILGDPFPSFPSEYFGDPSHLNSKGADVWTDHVTKLLNDAHVEGGPFGLHEP